MNILKLTDFALDVPKRHEELWYKLKVIVRPFKIHNGGKLTIITLKANTYNVHITYAYVWLCMHMYGCELWDLNRNYVKDFKVAWRKIKRRIWKLPYRTHNAIVHNLSYNIDFQIDTKMIKFIHSCLNHSNIVCKSIVLSKLYCIKSTIGSNYKYLSCKYGISQDDWYTNLSQLFKKVNMKCHEEMQHRNAAQTVCS